MESAGASDCNSGMTVHVHRGLLLTHTPATCVFRTQHLLRSTAMAFGTLAVGYALMTVSPVRDSRVKPFQIVIALGSAWVQLSVT